MVKPNTPDWKPPRIPDEAKVFALTIAALGVAWYLLWLFTAP